MVYISQPDGSYKFLPINMADGSPMPRAKSWDDVVSGRYKPTRSYKASTLGTLTSNRGRYWQTIPDAQINVVKSIRAGKALAAASDKLRFGWGEIKMHFVRAMPSAAGADVVLDSGEGRAVMGFATYDGVHDKAVYLVDALTDEDSIVRTVGHEVRHIWHRAWAAEPGVATPAEEQDCKGWAAQFESDYEDGLV